MIARSRHITQSHQSFRTSNIFTLLVIPWSSRTSGTICWSVFFRASRNQFLSESAVIRSSLHGQLLAASLCSKHTAVHHRPTYHQHPNCILSYFSSSKTKLIFSKHILTFFTILLLSILASVHTVFATITPFGAFGFFFKAITVELKEITGPLSSFVCVCVCVCLYVRNIYIHIHTNTHAGMLHASTPVDQQLRHSYVNVGNVSRFFQCFAFSQGSNAVN